MTQSYYIKECEQRYKNEIEAITDSILSKPDIKLILIAGPSCSGKTTTSATLASLLYEKGGVRAHTISIDDFYKDVVFLPGETFADKDFEALDSIDIDLLHECLHDLSIGKTVDIPLFDFEKTYRDGIRCRMSLGDNEIAIIEGLHALNPVIYKNFVDENKICSIFLDCIDNSLSGEKVKYPRLIRRLVRDNNFRNADAHLTFTLWEKVLIGEEKHIYPFLKYADFSVNTFHGYETKVLKPFAERLLDEIKSDSIFFKQSSDVLDFLKEFHGTISSQSVPSDSMLKEFIK